MAMANETPAGRWFRRVVWAGIAANLFLAVPALIDPSRVLAQASLPAATPDLWPRFSSLLLVLLSLFYVPAALDIDRFRATAWLAVGSRLAGVVFFGLAAADYRLFMYFDLAFLVPLAVLLVAATRTTPRR